MTTPLLAVRDLRTEYRSFGGDRIIRAVDGVSFTLEPGQTIGLVGESGCGKTTTCLSVVGLLPRGAEITGGDAEFVFEDSGSPTIVNDPADARWCAVLMPMRV